MRQSAGETPAIRWSRLHFKIAGVLLAFQDRRRLACVPSDSQAGRLRSFSIFFYKKIVLLAPQKLPKRNLINKFLRTVTTICILYFW
ncbi:MAG: hypothetical protein LBP59_05415 [Planctomycetaceae bacterium]|nr:hypothetical protein [Planctomycetaceae bacterium]